MNYLGTIDPGYVANPPTELEKRMARAREIQTELNTLYQQAAKPGLGLREQRNLDKLITELECELDELLKTPIQAQYPSGYYVPEKGLLPTTGQVEVTRPALVLGKEAEPEKERKFPWWALVVAGGAATYFSIRG
ncbi:MAG: hypothetical protein ACYTEQ_19870 [Planctomycetota bacterium]|jgi:hypothetical protein